MLSVIAMRRPEDEELGHGDGDEFVDISQMQLVVEAGPSGLQYAGPAPPLAQPAPPSVDTASTASTSVDDLFALYFTPATQGKVVTSLNTSLIRAISKCYFCAFCTKN